MSEISNTENNNNFQSNKCSHEHKLKKSKEKYKTVKINEKIKGKAVRISKGSFGKVYKVYKIIDIDSHENEIKNILPFAQKHTRIFEKDGNLIGQNLKEISIGYNYLKENENLQEFTDIIINEKDEIVNSKYILNMSLADMTFLDVINLDISKKERISLFFPILAQIIKGIYHIHSNYICHGDIKPENILVYGDKNKLENGYIYEYLNSALFKISDYSGINIEYNISMDKTSTLYYRAPEYFLKTDEKFKKTIKEKHGSFNDVWSIGIMMLEFLTKENLISNLIKKNSKMKEKEFLTRFFNCMKSVDISFLMKNNGYDLNNKIVKKICDIIELMLMKKIEERINIYNLSIFINFYIENNSSSLNTIPLYNNIIEYPNDIIRDVINLKSRKYAIDEFNKFLIKEYDEDNIYLYKQYLPLGLLLFDRFISKGFFKNLENNNVNYQEILNDIYKKVLFECYYIASKFLLCDMDIYFIIDYLKIDIYIIHNDIIEIINLMDYDIYRPTILTFLNKEKEDIYHLKYIIDSAINLFCDTEKINTNYKKSVEWINTIVENERYILESDSDTFICGIINEKNINKPKLERQIL
jgi:serine/threonine protein kinase